MATLRYNENDQMPDYLKSAAQKTLAATDASISGFNDRMKFFPMQTSTPQRASAPAGPQSSFSFSLNGGNDSQQLSLNGVPSSAPANGVPATAPVNGGDNWRFKSFGPSLLDSKPVSLTGPDSTFKTSPDAYGQIKSQGLLPNGLTPVSSVPGSVATSPDAYHQVISNYKPRDMTKEREQYGWGGGQ